MERDRGPRGGARFAAIGGTGLAGGLAKPGKAQYAPASTTFSEKKVTVCHKGKGMIRISVNALPAHRSHGDSMGLCPALAAAKAKAAKAKAAESDDQSGEADIPGRPGTARGMARRTEAGREAPHANGKEQRQR